MPFILVLLCLHKEEDRWLEQTESELQLRNCVYWTRLQGPVTDNVSTKRRRLVTWPRGAPHDRRRPPE